MKDAKGARGSASSTNDPVDAPLDSTVWEKVTEDLLERVLAKVPIPSLLRFRCVSKHWNSIIIPSLASRGEIHGPPMLVHFGDVFGKREGVSLRWMELGAISDWREFSCPPNSLPYGLDARAHLVASERGLLFFVLPRITRSEADLDVLVWNPVTGKHKRLSPPATAVSCLAQTSAGVVFTTQAGHYKLVVAGTTPDGEHIELVFDSATGIWKHTAAIAELVRSREWRVWVDNRGICYGGNLYFSLHDVGRPTRTMVVKFDPRQEIWTVVESRPRTTLPRTSQYCQNATDNRDVRLLMEIVGCDLSGRLDDLDHLRGTQECEVMSQKEVAQLRGFLQDYTTEQERNWYPMMEYFFFRHEDMRCHVTYLWKYASWDGSTIGGVLNILVHNPSDNSYSHIYRGDAPTRKLLRGRTLGLWLFKPSLTSVV